MIRTTDNKVYPLMIFVVYFSIAYFLSYALVMFLLKIYRKEEHSDQISTPPYKKPKILREKNSSKTGRFSVFPILR